MSRIFNPVLLFVATTAAILLALLVASFAHSTSTDPLPVDGSDLPKRFLMRDQQSGALSFAFTDAVPGKFPVATYRFGGYDFQSVTGWFYLQITSRLPTMTASMKAVEKEHVKKRSSAKSSGSIKMPNEDRLRDLRSLSSSPSSYHQSEGSDNFFYAGFIEGTLGAQDGRMVFPQYSSGNTTYPPCQTKWLSDHFFYLNQQMTLAANNQITDPTAAAWWSQFINIWNQLDGIATGYNTYSGTSFTTADVYMANMAMDAADGYCKEQTGKFTPSLNHISTVHKTSMYSFKKSQGVPERHLGQKPHTYGLGPGLHCSALIKVTSDDILSSHLTWSSWDGQYGYRTYKAYSLGSSRTVTMSGRLDGSVSSVDDFYASYGAGSNAPIAVFETTEEIFNMSLYKSSVPQLCAEFSRVMVSNYIATTPKAWTEYFAYKNGGEYCNSYTALDMSQFTPGQPLPAGAFYVAEQVPGFVAITDATYFVNQNSYFPSFNIPWQQSVYVMSGNQQAYEKYGNFYSWTKYARPEIFARNQSDVTDLPSMMRMMRYNDWENDPFSDIAPQWKDGCAGATDNTCSPQRSSMFTIASRGDLMKVYPTQAEMEQHYGSTNPSMVAQGCFGATDSKITSWKFARFSRTSFITNGPTNDQQPVFDWSGACNNVVPERTPAVMDYPWVMITIADDE